MFMFKLAENILRAVAKSYSISVDDLRGTARTGTIIVARAEAMYKIRIWAGLSFREIGILFGGRKSSTIIRNIHHYTEKELDN
uniref:Putative DNA replication initiation protein n=1 Tax=viral metagenome TaxID=1070528 RepID=A0A6H1ZZM3_9ZZZZ